MKRILQSLSGLVYFLACTTICSSLISCTDYADENITTQKERIIDVTRITDSSYTRSVNKDYSEGYHCSSTTSSLVADIYFNETCDEGVVNILNNKNEIAYCLSIHLDFIPHDSSHIYYTAFNELGEPIMSGIYNPSNYQFEISKVYGNDIVTRASAASWGCNLGLFAAGLAWSVPASMISMGASIFISAAYTAAAIEICDGL